MIFVESRSSLLSSECRGTGSIFSAGPASACRAEPVLGDQEESRSMWRAVRLVPGAGGSPARQPLPRRGWLRARSSSISLLFRLHGSVVNEVPILCRLANQRIGLLQIEWNLQPSNIPNSARQSTKLSPVYCEAGRLPRLNGAVFLGCRKNAQDAFLPRPRIGGEGARCVCRWDTRTAIAKKGVHSLGMIFCFNAAPAALLANVRPVIIRPWGRAAEHAAHLIVLEARVPRRCVKVLPSRQSERAKERAQ